MKKGLLSILFFFSLRADLLDLVPGVSQVKSAGSLIAFKGDLEEKNRRLEDLKKEKAELEANTALIDSLQSQYDAVTKQIAELKDKAAKKENEEFNRDLISTATETSQVLVDAQLARRKMLSNLDSRIAALENYLKDPYFKSLSIDKKATYKYENLEKVSSLISSQEDSKSHLTEEKANVEADLENRKKTLDDVEKTLKLAEKEQKEFPEKANLKETDIRQKSERIDYKNQYLKAKKIFLEQKISELESQLAILDLNLEITNKKLKILKEDLDTIDKSLWVNEGDVEETERSLTEKKQKYSESQVQLSTEIKHLIQRRERLKEELNMMMEKLQFPASEIPLLDDWAIDSSKKDSLASFYELGLLNDKVLRLDQEINLKEAQRELEKLRLASDEILTSIISSWYKISQRKIKTEEAIAAERAPYINYKNSAQRDLSSLKDKSNSASSYLNKLAKTLNNLKEKITDLEKSQEAYSKNLGKDGYKKAHSSLRAAEGLVNKQVELVNKQIETYTATISLINDTLKQTKVIVAKLDSIGGLLHRSEHAISWSSLKNILPDLKQFILDLKNMVYSVFTQSKLQNYYAQVTDIFGSVKSTLTLFLFVALILILFFFLKTILPVFINISSERIGVLSGATTSTIVALVLGFVLLRLKSIYFWFVFFFLIKSHVITDLGLRVAFYLFSIPFLITLINRFTAYLLEFNKKHKYALLSKFFERRFSIVLWFFLSSTATIFFFRDAFMALTYSRSELPTLLLALYSIIFRALLIFLIGKDELLEIVPQEKNWQWLRSFISGYYYPILVSVVALMVISDPYIGGFSKLVSFMLWSTIWTAVLAAMLWWGQIFVRKYSAYVFFSSEGELDGAKERFAYAKTLYGLFMVLAFLLSIFVGIFIGSKIWGYSFGLEKFQDVWEYSFFIDKSPVTIGAIAKLIGFVALGFVFAWAVNQFILQKIFDILLIDVGVQNTVSSITKYVIVVAVFLVGLLQVNLGSLIPVLVGAIVLGLAFAVKGPVNDFVAYFIILVERPIKLGDYIEVSADVKGFVRKITARTVILRRKNSFTVVVPNSLITTSSFANWNYVQGFVGFDDIHITIPYTADPVEAKRIFSEVLEANPNVLKSPKPIIRLDEFSENGFFFMVRGYISTINIINKWQIASDVRFAIVKELNANGIRVASPVRRIFMASDSGAEIKGK